MADQTIKKCPVSIGGITYQLVTSQDEAYTRQVAAKADERIRQLLHDYPNLNQTMATVLALVNSLDELTRAYRRLQSVDDRDEGHQEQLRQMRQELNRLREENWELKKDLLQLQDSLRQLQEAVEED